MFIDLRERGKKRERGRERNIDEGNIDRLPPVHVLTGDWTWNLGKCSDWESNLQPLGV